MKFNMIYGVKKHTHKHLNTYQVPWPVILIKAEIDFQGVMIQN